MGYTSLWKYCDIQQCQDFLLSLGLIDGEGMARGDRLKCLYAVSRHTETHYRKTYRKKADGSLRPLLEPDYLLKHIQRNLLRNVLEKIPVSECAAAYRKGVSIKDNAAVHVGRPQILKLDIENFFGSITESMVFTKVFPREYFPYPAAALLTALCCFEGYLPQGAPTSAAASNLVMKEFDQYMDGWCRERGIIYTRYCDDLTFSGAFDRAEVKNKVRAFLNAMGFELNKKKTQHLTAGQRQTVTGVVVNEKLQVPRDYRRELRQIYFYCKTYGVESHLHNKLGREASGTEVRDYFEHFLGRVNFVLQINPEDRYFREVKAWILERKKEACHERL